MTAISHESPQNQELYIRGRFFHLLENPAEVKNDKESYEYIEDGLLIIKNGKIVDLLPWENFKPDKKVSVIEYKDSLIIPGLIDTHIHYAQTEMIAVNHHGLLLDWLKNHTFPLEENFSEKKYAQEVAHFFIKELLRNGTTTALVFATIHPQSVDALFKEAEKIGMCVISGKVMCDKNTSTLLKETPEDSYLQTLKLIKKWHKKTGTRLQYALTPRFALSCSASMLKMVKKLKEEFEDIYVQTHISENELEVEVVKKFHNVGQYLDVYDKFNLLGPKTILAHGVWLTNSEHKKIHKKQCKIAFCPSSNSFLGSGMFDYKKARQYKIDIGLGTDIGAGTSFSLFQTLNEAYKITKFKDYNLTVLESFYLATLGGAKALNLENNLGNFKRGKDADFVVLNFKNPTPLIERRLALEKKFLDKLFVFMMLSDDRSVLYTYVHGKKFILKSNLKKLIFSRNYKESSFTAL